MDIERVHPDLRTATQKLPVPDASKKLVRIAIRLATRLMPVPRTESVTVTTVTSGGVRLRIYVPDTRLDEGGLLWIHGGGLLFGDARQDEALCAQTARDLGIVVVSANYRFAPEHPFPAAHNDVYAAWQWMLAHAAELGLDPARLVVGGESAGAGLAAALVQRLHDDDAVQPVAQWLFAPMIDDRTAADESLDSVDHWVWNNRANRVGWSGYLGDDFARHDLPPYAAAARRTDLRGLPPAFIAVGDIELFYAEDRDYADRLEQAGVPVELDIVPGAPHGFENWARDTEPAQALMRRAHAWLRAALANVPV
ncbi:alpha/beta hydrolase [Cryobacterium arcticum]|uniref:Alpha/beta hydrolase n=1 Tax=Cryobacterium arcticum TaxID=670052 RepID=A0A317ZT67_9MICO|nr:alpha/beta hydrolase [Cryobacterium arcticum]PXA68319.1 alpha/beta hydrolase [Cryobacterium arcticum]